MARMTQSITLNLIGSAVLLAGCAATEDHRTEEEKKRDEAARSGSSTRPHGSSYFWSRGSAPTLHGSSGSGAGGRTGTSTASRGGFGSTGHSVVS